MAHGRHRTPFWSQREAGCTGTKLAVALQYVSHMPHAVCSFRVYAFLSGSCSTDPSPPYRALTIGSAQ